MVEFLLQYHAYTTPETEGKDCYYPGEKYMGYRLSGQGYKILASCLRFMNVVPRSTMNINGETEN